jgi:hypothetical protein
MHGDGEWLKVMSFPLSGSASVTSKGTWQASRKEDTRQIQKWETRSRIRKKDTKITQELNNKRNEESMVSRNQGKRHNFEDIFNSKENLWAFGDHLLLPTATYYFYRHNTETLGSFP